MAAIRDYGRAGFDLDELAGDDKKPLQEHLALLLSTSTRGEAQDHCMNRGEPTDGRALFSILTKAFGGCQDDGATAIAALEKIALDTFLDLGPFQSAWKQNLLAYYGATGTEIPKAQQQ